LGVADPKGSVQRYGEHVRITAQLIMPQLMITFGLNHMTGLQTIFFDTA